MRMILVLAAAASLSACASRSIKTPTAATPPPIVTPIPAPVPILPAVSDALTRAEAAYARLAPAARRVLAVLPEPYRGRGTDVLDRIGNALRLARQARTLGAQLDAVRQADGLIAQIGRLTAAR